MSLDEIIAHRSALPDRLSERPAGRALSQAGDAGARRRHDGGFGEALPRAVAINYAKLLAYKDEYEVARLFTDGASKSSSRPVRRRLQVQLQSRAADPRRRQGCAGPAEEARVRRVDDEGVPVLAALRGLRGTPLDIFGYSADRKLERDLIAGYEKDVATCSACCRR
jgi:indolepyruvate ferredoxin oxidoreductase